MATTSVCKDCHGTMRWVRMRTGSAMPVEPIPDDRGNVAALRGTNGQLIDGQVIKKGTDHDALRIAGYQIFLPHKAVCGGGRDPRPRADQPGLF